MLNYEANDSYNHSFFIVALRAEHYKITIGRRHKLAYISITNLEFRLFSV